MSKIANIVEYAEILRTHGVGSRQAVTYKRAFKDDKAFQRRAATAEALLTNKAALMTKLKAEQPA